MRSWLIPLCGSNSHRAAVLATLSGLRPLSGRYSRGVVVSVSRGPPTHPAGVSAPGEGEGEDEDEGDGDGDGEGEGEGEGDATPPGGSGRPRAARVPCAR